MQIVGQEKLLNILNAYLENNSLPNSLLFVGEKGCGKHTIASYISSRLNIDIVDISEQITEEYLIDRYISANKNIYLLDFSSISIFDKAWKLIILPGVLQILNKYSLSVKFSNCCLEYLSKVRI